MTVSFSAVERTLYRAKVLRKNATNVSSISTTYSNSENMKKYGTTLSGKRFFKHVFTCEQFSYCIFASDDIIQEFQAAIPVASRHFLMDATFNICQFGKFSHILIIHVAYRESVNILILMELRIKLMCACVLFYFQHVVPFLYVFMSCKLQICYEHIFCYINDNICVLEGVSFMTDYEAAMRNALAEQYPGSNHRNCWFHYCQKIKKDALRFDGFEQLIRSNQLEREIYYKLMCLPLLPENLILDAFNDLKSKSEPIEAVGFHNFLAYFERQWMQCVRIPVRKSAG